MKYLLCIASFLFLFRNSQAQSEDPILNFISTHKDHSSLFLKRNDTVIASLNADKMMPLASTMKIMVAIEFSKQAAFKVFDPDAMVALPDLEKYYIPGTDGGAHLNWINAMKQENKIDHDSVSLLDVATGMIVFSSNANTEYLMDKLGLDNINNNYRLMGIKDYTPLYYFVSALMLYQNPKGLKEAKVLKQIRDLSQEVYFKATSMIHEQLKYNPAYKKLFRPLDLTIPMQKEWSNRLPQSTTKAYNHIAEIINKRKIYSTETYAILSQILETIMRNPANQQWLDHSGMKGGSTMFILTKTLYATLKSGVQIELSYFFNDLENNEVQELAKQMNNFELKVLTDEDFSRKIAAVIKQ